MRPGRRRKKGLLCAFRLGMRFFLCKAAVLDLPEERLPNGQEGEQNGYEDRYYRRWQGGLLISGLPKATAAGYYS